MSLFIVQKENSKLNTKNQKEYSQYIELRFINKNTFLLQVNYLNK